MLGGCAITGIEVTMVDYVAAAEFLLIQKFCLKTIIFSLALRANFNLITFFKIILYFVLTYSNFLKSHISRPLLSFILSVDKTLKHKHTNE